MELFPELNLGVKILRYCATACVDISVGSHPTCKDPNGVTEGNSLLEKVASTKRAVPQRRLEKEKEASIVSEIKYSSVTEHSS